MFNKVIMIGNLTRDVELRYLPSGNAVATIGLASNRRYKKQDGTQGEEVCFVDVKLFGRTAEVANQYLRKGSKILIDGKLTFESWVDQMGAKKSRHVITAESMQMLDGRPDSQQAQSHETYPQYNQSAPTMKQAPQYGANPTNNPHNIPEINIDEDEIPF